MSSLSLLVSSSDIAFSHFDFFFFNATATTEIYTLSLHDALPISSIPSADTGIWTSTPKTDHPRWVNHLECSAAPQPTSRALRSEEHTSELQSLRHLVCRLLLEKKNKKRKRKATT